MPRYEYTIETPRGIEKIVKIHHEPITDADKASIRAHYLAYGSGTITAFREITEPNKPGRGGKRKPPRRKVKARK